MATIDIDSSSSEAQIFRSSETSAYTVHSDSTQAAMAAGDIVTVSDSPVYSAAPTIEQIESSHRSIVSVRSSCASSDDEDI
eukprot:9111550-Heterocapsa_arctica.AAC.1